MKQIDHFKVVNDAYGHLAGDALLHEFGETILRNLRSIDRVGRWGGEEFVVILSHTGADVACEAAERVRQDVERHIFGMEQPIRITCSVGVACYPEDGSDRDELLELADRSLYRAKELGRNQVCRLAVGVR